MESEQERFLERMTNIDEGVDDSDWWMLMKKEREDASVLSVRLGDASGNRQGLSTDRHTSASYPVHATI